MHTETVYTPSELQDLLFCAKAEADSTRIAYLIEAAYDDLHRCLNAFDNSAAEQFSTLIYDWQ